MSFTDFEYKSGILGQGCYIHCFATRADFYHCKLPALTTLGLMDLGRWQLMHLTDSCYRDEAMSQQSWRIDNMLSTLENEGRRLSNSGGQADWLRPLGTLVECYWRADREQREQAILRLQQDNENNLNQRLARVLAQLPDNNHSTAAPLDN